MRECPWDRNLCWDRNDGECFGLWGVLLPLWQRCSLLSAADRASVCCLRPGWHCPLPGSSAPLCPPSCPPKNRPWRARTELVAPLPPHRRIFGVEVELCRCPGEACVRFTVFVDYEDCCGCRRCLRRVCRKGLELPAEVCHVCLAGQPDFRESCGRLTVCVELTEG